MEGNGIEKHENKGGPCWPVRLIGMALFLSATRKQKDIFAGL